MIPKECKRLAEVDFPIARVSVFARAEKDSRIAHIPRLHVWPAARPGGACRSILLGMLLPDPCDNRCPGEFKKAARESLAELPSAPSRWKEELKADEGLRKALLEFIGDFANWDNAGDLAYIRCAQALMKAAHDEAPVVADPFAGGGIIPLEAARLGCDAISSDLNPVAGLIQSVVLESMPRHIEEMIDTLPSIGASIRAAAIEALRELYPPDTEGSEPAAYLWARSVRCEAPHCGAEIPLVRSFWLAKRAHRRRALRYEVARTYGSVPTLRLEVFEPTRESDVPPGTVSRAKATCPCCDSVLSPDRVRAQLAAQSGGSDVQFDSRGRRIGGAMLIAVATVAPGTDARCYRVATADDYATVLKSQRLLHEMLERWDQDGRRGLCPVPDEPTPEGGGSGAGRAFSVQNYGMLRWRDVFTARQLVAMSIFCRLSHDHVPETTRPLVALLISKVIDLNNALTVWHNVGERPAHMLSRWAIPMKWDFVEPVPISEFSGSLDTALARTMHLLRDFSVRKPASLVTQADACEQILPDESVSVWFTDPPYYDAIPYADLSDFFYVWLRRALPHHPLLRDASDPSNPLTPKVNEAVQDERRRDSTGARRDKTYFERKMQKAFTIGRRVLREDGIGCVVFAHKTTEGWEALLSGLIAAGWVITASWPIATEMSSRLRARESAALATSVHLVCRPRPVDAPVGDWADVLRELPRRVGDWMERLQAEGVRGADLVFACIGPALEIFSRYRKVETADGREVKLAEYLEKVWEVVGRTALENVLGTAEAKARNGIGSALEEDARLTALFLWTLQSTNGSTSSCAREEAAEDDEEIERSDDTSEEEEEDTGEEARATKRPKGLTLIFDVVRRFAQPLGIHLPDWEGRIIETRKGVVRLLPVRERARQLFGEAGASLAADRIEAQAKRSPQATFDFMAPEPAVPTIKGRKKRKPATSDVSDESLRAHRGATTLDRVHAAMLLQASGRANALRALLKSEIDRGSDFMRLANALSALYPAGSDEKRLLDAMLLAVPR